MHKFFADCRIVQMENPIESWHDSVVRSLFEKTITLKLEGFALKFPHGVLPVDESDWIADHFLICRHDHGDLKPVMGFRRVTLARCREYFQKFAPVLLCHESGCAQHIREMDKLIDRFEGQPDKVSYTGSFTVIPELQADSTLTLEFLHLMLVLHYLFHEDQPEGYEIIAAAAPRFRHDVLLSTCGFTPLVEASTENNDGMIPVQHVAGERLRVLHARAVDFNLNLKRLAEPYRELWTNRVVLGRDLPRSKADSQLGITCSELYTL